MKPEEREALENEWREVIERLRGENPDPKDLRRKEEITSLLMTDGESKDIKFNFLKGKKSNRVTSFTRDRR
jgi:hypothetical protein